jgi:hypothetical protein
MDVDRKVRADCPQGSSDHVEGDEHQHHQKSRIAQFGRDLKVGKLIESSHFLWLEFVVW